MMKVCIDCGIVFPAENFGAKRCCLCAAKHKTKPAAPKVWKTLCRASSRLPRSRHETEVDPMAKVTGVVSVPLLGILREFAATADLTGRPTRYPEGAAQFAARKEKEAHDSN